jgi:hypothetical protein
VSIKVMNLVWASTVEGPAKRFTLLALADRANDQGECSALGVPTLCLKTGIKRSTMFGLLRDLEQEDNLIQREERTWANGSRKRSRFWINLPLLTTMQRPTENELDSDEPVNPFGVSAAHSPVQNLDRPRPAAGRSPVQNLDGLGVHDLDGARPGHGPLLPFSSSDTERNPETYGRIEAAPEQKALAARIVSGADLRRCGPSPKQVNQITGAVAAALARGVPAPVVAEHARGKAQEAQTVKYLLRAFSEEHLPASPPPAPSAPALRPPCGRCDARPGDPIGLRQTTDADGRAVKCPHCHPHASEVAR